MSPPLSQNAHTVSNNSSPSSESSSAFSEIQSPSSTMNLDVVEF
uniref:Uncharacterized protein n=1 Tax=Rhizophora mucronata TaxID=61149 RepID=A0A2P2LWM3_RHIMU